MNSCIHAQFTNDTGADIPARVVSIRYPNIAEASRDYTGPQRDAVLGVVSVKPGVNLSSSLAIPFGHGAFEVYDMQVLTGESEVLVLSMWEDAPPPVADHSAPRYIVDVYGLSDLKIKTSINIPLPQYGFPDVSQLSSCVQSKRLVIGDEGQQLGVDFALKEMAWRRVFNQEQRRLRCQEIVIWKDVFGADEMLISILEESRTGIFNWTAIDPKDGKTRRRTGKRDFAAALLPIKVHPRRPWVFCVRNSPSEAKLTTVDVQKEKVIATLDVTQLMNTEESENFVEQRQQRDRDGIDPITKVAWSSGCDVCAVQMSTGNDIIVIDMKKGVRICEEVRIVGQME